MFHINDRILKIWLKPKSYTYKIWWLLIANPHYKPSLFAVTCARAWASLVPTKWKPKEKCTQAHHCYHSCPCTAVLWGNLHQTPPCALCSPSIKKGQRKNSWRRKRQTKLINSSLRQNTNKSLHFICQPEACIIHHLSQQGHGKRVCEATAAGSGSSSRRRVLNGWGEAGRFSARGLSINIAPTFFHAWIFFLSLSHKPLVKQRETKRDVFAFLLFRKKDSASLGRSSYKKRFLLSCWSPLPGQTHSPTDREVNMLQRLSPWEMCCAKFYTCRSQLNYQNAPAWSFQN